MLIYFAAPFFCHAERAFNLHLATKLEENGFSVFLPQRDGVELKNERISNLTEEELVKTIFNIDRAEIIKADVFLIIFDGRVPDEGACVELGIAHENKVHHNQTKLLIGFKNDMRVFAEKLNLNAMLLGPLDEIVDNEHDLLQKIEAFRTENT